jgi:hypothetical protein
LHSSAGDDPFLDTYSSKKVLFAPSPPTPLPIVELNQGSCIIDPEIGGLFWEFWGRHCLLSSFPVISSDATRTPACTEALCDTFHGFESFSKDVTWLRDRLIKAGKTTCGLV